MICGRAKHVYEIDPCKFLTVLACFFQQQLRLQLQSRGQFKTFKLQKASQKYDAERKMALRPTINLYEIDPWLCFVIW